MIEAYIQNVDSTLISILNGSHRLMLLG